MKPMTDHVIEVSRSTDSLDEEPDERRINDWLCAALNALQQPPSEVSVRIVGVEEMTALNHEYRQKPAPTNVLSFPAGLTADGITFLGDIVICSDVVRDESVTYAKDFSHRYAHMLIHGLLHLLGRDHQDDAERLQMEAEERSLLAAFNIPNPYEVQNAS